MSYTVPEDIHQELLNWSRWCWTGEWPHPGMVPMFPDDEDDRGAPGEPNARHAVIVQQAWERMHLDARLVLRAEYPKRTGQGREFEARRLAMSLDRYERELQCSAIKVGEAMDAVFA